MIQLDAGKCLEAQSADVDGEENEAAAWRTALHRERGLWDNGLKLDEGQ